MTRVHPLPEADEALADGLEEAFPPLFDAATKVPLHPARRVETAVTGWNGWSATYACTGIYRQGRMASKTLREKRNTCMGILIFPPASTAEIRYKIRLSVRQLRQCLRILGLIFGPDFVQ